MDGCVGPVCFPSFGRWRLIGTSGERGGGHLDLICCCDCCLRCVLACKPPVLGTVWGAAGASSDLSLALSSPGVSSFGWSGSVGPYQRGQLKEVADGLEVRGIVISTNN